MRRNEAAVYVTNYSYISLTPEEVEHYRDLSNIYKKRLAREICSDFFDLYAKDRLDEMTEG